MLCLKGLMAEGRAFFKQLILAQATSVGNANLMHVVVHERF